MDPWGKIGIPRKEDVKHDQVIKVVRDHVERNGKPDVGVIRFGSTSKYVPLHLINFGFTWKPTAHFLQ